MHGNPGHGIGIMRKCHGRQRGGDEFLVLLAEVTQASDAAQLAGKILSALAVPSQIGPHVLQLSASIGIALFPDDGETAPALINRADEAMYHAKKSGGNRVVIYNSDIPPLHPARHRAVETPTA